MTVVLCETAQPRLKAETRRATQRDSYNILRENAAVLNQYEGDDYMVSSLRHFGMCLHTSTLYRETDTPDEWQPLTLTHDVYLDMDMDFLAQWLQAIFLDNPLLAMQEVTYLRNFLNGVQDLPTSSTNP